MPYLGERLRELRGELSLMDIARECGLSDVQIMKYEKGQRMPRKETLKKLADLYGVPYSELRKLYYQDVFSSDPEELRIVLDWASERLKS